MSGLSPWSHQGGWSCTARHVGDARRFVHQHLEGHGLARVASNVSLAVSELATNAVVHAGTPFTVTLAGRDGMTTIAVRDLSPVQLPASRPAVGQLDRPRGRGLQIVQALSSECGVVRDGDGKSVWASFETGDIRFARAVTPGRS
jgi:anti-sigma regulatory factor (Ser/Thr protein kinase)